jgi:hypothetical protein
METMEAQRMRRAIRHVLERIEERAGAAPRVPEVHAWR